jgi:hypothetical protein
LEVFVSESETYPWTIERHPIYTKFYFSENSPEFACKNVLFVDLTVAWPAYPIPAYFVRQYVVG